VAAGFIAAATLGCSEPLVFPDWTIEVPEATPVVEYADVTAEERAGKTIELVEELVIAARPGDDNYTFFNPRYVNVDSRGNIYVLDGGNSRVQMFDDGGEYVRTLGGEGSGPGEFRAGRGGFTQVDMTVAGDHLIAFDGAQARLSIWSPDGEHLGDHAVTEPRVVGFIAGLDDGATVVETSARSDQGSLRGASRLSMSGAEELQYIALPRPSNFMVGGRIGLANPTGEIVYAGDSDGALYASTGVEYQVVRFDHDGSMRWALRVAHERTPFTDEDRDRIVEILLRNFPDLDARDTDWPDRLGSIGRLAVDGHGHLYVYAMQPLFVPTPKLIAVDVYAADGERLFSGTMPPFSWTDAAGDLVYGVRRNEQTEEDEPVRYRLREPF
jgi:hypothetical protein